MAFHVDKGRPRREFDLRLQTAEVSSGESREDEGGEEEERRSGDENLERGEVECGELRQY